MNKKELNNLVENIVSKVLTEATPTMSPSDNPIKFIKSEIPINKVILLKPEKLELDEDFNESSDTVERKFEQQFKVLYPELYKTFDDFTINDCDIDNFDDDDIFVVYGEYTGFLRILDLKFKLTVYIKDQKLNSFKLTK